MASLAPPPKRLVASAPSTRVSSPGPDTWKTRFVAKSKVWGTKAIDKTVVISDNVGGKVNNFTEKRLGTEAFWPTSGDFPKEMDKAARIMRAFTVEGVVQQDKKTKKKFVRKVPPSIIANAKGLAIFTSMRSGIAPLGGAGGAGVVVAKLPDGTWSAPCSISPNNISTGFLLGMDIYDCILVIRTQAALDSFGTHKFTLGTEIGVAAGPYGAGAAAEAGRETSPVFSYVKSKGLFAGVEIVGQVFVERFDENANMYHWPGIKARDILSGKVPVPLEAANLQQALKDASTGRAQRANGIPLDAPLQPVPVDDQLAMDDGEVLKLPPTPEMTDGHEGESDPETVSVWRRSIFPNHPGATPPALPPRHAKDVNVDGPCPTELTHALSTAAGPPPPLPPRSRNRPTSMPVIPANYSLPFSSDVAPGELPPSYDADTVTSRLSQMTVNTRDLMSHEDAPGPSSVLTPEEPEPTTPLALRVSEEGMSESERRERAQHEAALAEAAAERDAALLASPVREIRAEEVKKEGWETFGEEAKKDSLC